MKTCNHPTCEDLCRREKKPKKVYVIPKVSGKPKVKKEKRVKLVPIPKLIQKAQKICNEYIRLRDEGKPCISCGSDKANQAGHYISVRMSSFLRFDERNIWSQCPFCNLYNYGSPITYRMELRKRLGDFELEKLERDYLENKRHKWDRQSLEEIILKYSEKIKLIKGE